MFGKGLVVTIPGIDELDTARKLLFPVPGADYCNIFGANSDPARNLALGSDLRASVVGTPVLRKSYVVVSPGVSYIETGAPQGADYTIIVIARPVADQLRTAAFSNMTGTQGATSMFFEPGTPGNGFTQPRMQTRTPNNSGQISNAPDVDFDDMPGVFVTTYDAATRISRLRDLRNSIDISADAAPSAAIFGNTMKVGSLDAGPFPGDCRVYFAAYFRRVLTETEVQDAYTYLQSLYLRKFALPLTN